MPTKNKALFRVLCTFGTRPEAIKMCPLIMELKKHSEIETIVCVTGQHREMLDQVLEVFEISPDYDLNIMKEKQTLNYIVQTILVKLEAVIHEVKPNLLLVHGDTTSTFAGALTAFHSNIAIGHVEAGLRTWNKYSPYPEEMNRQMVSCMADLHFAPTQDSANNLIREGKKADTVFVTGNTAIDALNTTIQKNYSHPLLNWIGNDRLILLTAHRRENIGSPMADIFRAIRQIIDDIPDIKVLYPIHKNPQVRAIAAEIFEDCDRLQLIEPLEVIDFQNIMNKSYLILTDSGGIQEEAPALGKPVLVLRDTTERPEGIKAKTLKLVGTKTENIYSAVLELLSYPDCYEEMSNACNPYGDGHASEKIVCEILSYLAKKGESSNES